MKTTYSNHRNYPYVDLRLAIRGGVLVGLIGTVVWVLVKVLI